MRLGEPGAGGPGTAPSRWPGSSCRWIYAVYYSCTVYIYIYLHRLLIADCFCDGNHGVLALFSLSFSFSFASSWASSSFHMRFFSTYCLATPYYASSSIDRRTTDTKGIHLSARHYCSALSTSTMLHPTCALCTPFPPTLLTATDNGTMGHIPPCPPVLLRS